MATLLNAVTSNTTGSGASHDGPCTVFARGTFDGARVVIQIADENVAASFQKADNISTPNPARFDGHGGTVTIHGQGTYFVRAILENAGGSTSVTVVTTQ